MILKFFLGFVIGVAGASAVAYLGMKRALPVVSSTAVENAAPAKSPSVPDAPPPPSDPAPVPDAAPDATPAPPSDSDPASPAPVETHPQINLPAPAPGEAPKQEKSRNVTVPYPVDARRIPAAPVEARTQERYPSRERYQKEPAWIAPEANRASAISGSIAESSKPRESVARGTETQTPEPSAPSIPAPPDPVAAVGNPEPSHAPLSASAVSSSSSAESVPASPAVAPREWHTLPVPDASASPRRSALLQRSSVSGPFGAQASGPLASLRPEVPPIAAPREPSVSLRQPSTVTLPSGTPISIRLGETLSTRDNHTGDNFSATLDRPLIIDGMVIAERGQRVDGTIVDARTAGRIRGTPELAVELTSVHTSDGQVVAIHTASYVRREGRGAFGPAGRVGGGAVIGAAVGAIAGAGVGAAIGAGVGSVAGMGSALVTRRRPLVIPAETLLTFRLDQPVTITEQLR